MAMDGDLDGDGDLMTTLVLVLVLVVVVVVVVVVVLVSVVHDDLDDACRLHTFTSLARSRSIPLSFGRKDPWVQLRATSPPGHGERGKILKRPN